MYLQTSGYLFLIFFSTHYILNFFDWIEKVKIFGFFEKWLFETTKTQFQHNFHPIHTQYLIK